MGNLKHNRKRWLTCGLLAAGGTVGALALLLGAHFLFTSLENAGYPDSERISAHTVLSGMPAPGFRRDTSYRTPDNFVEVHNWYSVEFLMGGEIRAQSGCSHLFKSHQGLLSTQTMGVTICETPNGRLVFVQRSLYFQLR